MESEKVKEIKKALEHCGEKVTCQGCPEYNNEPVIDWFKCKKNLLQKTITLINYQDFQISTLKVQVANLEKELKKEQINHLYYRQDSQFKESRIAELEKENKDYYDRLNNLQTYIDNHEEIWKVNTKTQLKQFAGRLKEKAIKRQEFIGELAIDDIEYVKKQDIDETLKELINE